MSLILGSFYARNTSALKPLYALLGAEWSDDPQQNARTAQALWLGSEHGQTVAQYPQELLDRAHPLFEQMGLLGATLPLPGEILESTQLIGGTLNANVRRYKLVKHLEQELWCTLGPIVGWYGQRLREARDGTVAEIRDHLRAAGLTTHSWVKQQLSLDPNHPDPWQQPFATEFELGVVAALLEFGSGVELAETRFITEPPQIAGVPARTILWQQFHRPSGSDLIMLNAAATVRIMDGRPAQSRHVTKSCAEEWLANFPPTTGARVGVISGNPHTERTIKEVGETIASRGYTLQVVPMGTDEAKNNRLAMACLGEIARLLKNELL